MKRFLEEQQRQLKEINAQKRTKTTKTSASSFLLEEKPMKQVPKKRSKKKQTPRLSAQEKAEERKRKKQRARIKKSTTLVFDLLFYLLVVGIIVGSVLFVANKDSTKSFFGYRFYNVLTNSMVPQKDSPPGGFHSGDITIVQMATFSQVKKQDIVTFQVGQDAYLTHRLKEKQTDLNGEAGEYLITQGDANGSPDPPVDAKRLVGKVIFVIPYMGSALTFIREHFVVCLVFLISLFGFVWVVRIYFDQPEEQVRKRKKRVRVPTSH